MSIKQIAVAALSLLATAAVMAGANQANEWAKFQDPSQYAASPRSRAEVIADLEIYRKSGLADLDSRDTMEVFGADYQAAQARYRAMRASPEFTALVAKIARDRGEAVVTANTESGAVTQ